MSRPAVDVFDAVKPSVQTCRDSYLQTSTFLAHELPPLRLPSLPSPKSSPFDEPVYHQTQPLSSVRPPKRILLPPLPSSTPRKRTRMNLHRSTPTLPPPPPPPPPLASASTSHLVPPAPGNAPASQPLGDAQVYSLKLSHDIVQSNLNSSLPSLPSCPHFSTYPYSANFSSTHTVQNYSQLVSHLPHSYPLHLHAQPSHPHAPALHQQDGFQPSVLPHSYPGDPSRSLEIATIPYSGPSVSSVYETISQSQHQTYQSQQQPQLQPQHQTQMHYQPQQAPRHQDQDQYQHQNAQHHSYEQQSQQQHQQSQQSQHQYHPQPQHHQQFHYQYQPQLQSQLQCQPQPQTHLEYQPQHQVHQYQRQSQHQTQHQTQHQSQHCYEVQLQRHHRSQPQYQYHTQLQSQPHEQYHLQRRNQFQYESRPQYQHQNSQQPPSRQRETQVSCDVHHGERQQNQHGQSLLPLSSTQLQYQHEFHAQPSLLPLSTHVFVHDQLASDICRQEAQPGFAEPLNDRVNTTWLSDSSSTLDGTQHSFAHNSSATIVGDAPPTGGCAPLNVSTPRKRMKIALKRNRDVSALPVKATKMAKKEKTSCTAVEAVTPSANRGIGSGAAKCEDDRDGHLLYKLGEGLHVNEDFPNGRYKILNDLGEGTFGKVVECWDRRELRHVAIKVVRSISKYRQAARLEIDVLLHLNIRDPGGTYHCVKLHSWFEYHAHVCMVFEKLGPSLYDQLRRNRFQPFPLDQVRDYAFQLLESVNFVHSSTLIHTDLKPENILLASTDRSSNAIKLIDFGSATFETQHHSPLISTRHYRAPEVILGLGWTYPCDLWSIGCILVELYTGQALFQTHENLEHLAMMSHVLGPIPDSMIRRTDGQGLKYFRVKGGRRALNWPAGASSKASVRTVRHVQSLDDIIGCAHGHNEFRDLVKKLLAFEPDTRCTLAEALRHPFFQKMGHQEWGPRTEIMSLGWNATRHTENNRSEPVELEDIHVGMDATCTARGFEVNPVVSVTEGEEARDYLVG